MFRERASPLCRHGEKILLVRLREPKTGREYLFPPGGGLEAGESPAQAAIREALEETGYLIQLDSHPAQTLDYDFTWDGHVVRCRTHFFLARLVEDEPRPFELPPLHLGVEWRYLTELETLFSFHPELSAHIRACLER